MACSKKALVAAVLPLPMALLAAAAVSAAGRGGAIPLEAGGGEEKCSQVPACKEDLCGGLCAVLGVSGVGVCKDVGGLPHCCCDPTSSASAAAIGVHELVH